VISFSIYDNALGQTGYDVTQYTAKEGLPQNSIIGLAFDQHGFLWVATQGGITRFDGRNFKIIGEGDHPLIRNQRFTQAIPCIDKSILFTDVLNGMYGLSDDHFTTIRDPDSKYPSLIHIRGSLPYPQFLDKDSFFLAESRRERASLQHIFILPTQSGKVLIATDRIVLIDLASRKLSEISPFRLLNDQFAKLNQTILKLDINGQLHFLNKTETSFEPCVMKMENGQPWTTSMGDTRLYSQYPFTDVFISDGKKLFRILEGESPLNYYVHPILDKLPENCKIHSVAYNPTENVLVLGSDSRGAFVYREKHLKTYLTEKIEGRNNVYYAQCLLDSTTLLTSNGLILDPTHFKIKGHFPNPFLNYLLATDNEQNVYYANRRSLYKYNIASEKEIQISSNQEFITHSITQINGQIWVGTTLGLGQVREDSVHWIYKKSFISEQDGIKSISQDHEGNVWFGSRFQLYRLNMQTSQVDSFPELANIDIREITMIRNNPFIGTYGNGYFIFSDGRFVHMPDGRNHELSNSHSFIEDKNGYLWIPTNRGLYKTHLDAIEAYLKDSTFQLDYYTYLEEDGIYNAEFNGGCSPTYLRLPDGRLSLPTIEGLVVFEPEQTPHYFSKDSMVIEFIEVDGKQYKPEELPTIDADHLNITIHFAGAWWNNPYNQYVYLRNEESDSPYRLTSIDQSSLSIGLLRPGKHTFVIRRRCGFGPEDFVYSRIHFNVEKPWYAKGFAISMYVLCLGLMTWIIAALNSRTIRKRNIELQRKVDIQTNALLASNLQLEENVQKLAETEIHLRKNLSLRDRLMSIITHDILTPLRFIGQIARLAIEEKPADDGLPKQALSDVHSAVHKLFHSTQNLLHWVTYHQEHFTPSSVNCSPFAIVEQLIEDFSEMSRFQGNTLINNVPEDDIILTDPRILNIILHNLISNAIKYTKNGEIRVRSATKDQWYELEVKDTGRGMTAEQLEMIRTGANNQFDVKQQDISAGTGIGLSLVADLITILQGRWEINSPGGLGVIVKVFIPL